MQLSATGRHIEITDSMSQYLREKAGRLDRFYDRVERVEVVVEQEGVQFRIEMVVRADHNHTFVGQEKASDFYGAVDLVTDKLERQLSRHKERFRNRKHTKAGAEEKTPPPGA